MKRVLSLFLALVMVMQYVPATVFAAAEDNLCAHHAEHTADCGYAEEQPGSDCAHTHSMECYAVNECAHVHGEECAEACGHDCMKDVSCWQYDRICGHESLTQCGQECFQPICAHAKGQHDGSCGYAPATEAQPCLYECAECAAPEEPAAEPAPSEETPAELTSPEEPSTETTAPVEVAHEHEYTSDVTQPTCTEKGYTTYTCECGDSYRTPWLDKSAYEGKTIACVGDSITAAVGVTKDENDYVKLLSQQLGMDYIRLGASGTTLCTDGSRTCNIIRLTEAYLEGADVVTIAMGINDFCAAGTGYYELGDINSTDSSTIYGAARMWCERIAELRKTDSLKDTLFYFVTPVICSWNNSVTSARNWDQSKQNIHGYTLRDLCNAIIEVAELYDVAVIDLNLLSGMYYVDEEDNNTAVFGGDGVHPGATGHSMMANAMAHALLQDDLRDDHAHTFGSWITTTWPTCLAGEQRRVCTICTATQSRVTESDVDHSYAPTVTAPTCTEKGYTTYTCECGDSYVDDYVDATGHTYKNGICTACGAEHPNLTNYEGKVISILGDSISTFAGYIPVADGFNLQHRPRYPQSNLFSDVNLTWWMQTITALDAKLGINDSWAGSTVTNTITGNSGDLGEKAAMASLTRIQNLGANGTPDVILFYGGTNDIGRLLPLGSFDPATAPTEVDLTTTKWTTVADAYVDAIMRLQYHYPEAEILAMLPTYTTSYYTNAKLAQYNTVFSAICEHYGIPYIDLRDCGITTANLPDGIHPDASGMDYITEAVLDTLLNDMEMEAGEHIIHSVTHNLNGAESSLGYYKSITHGKSFVTTITGENVTVSVTMGGVDITDTAYANSVVTIAAVTGDLVITAQGRVKPIYEDHLQQLPENLCCSTNLWSSLVSENTYYTGSAWGNISGNSVYSITIPVAAGDQIWATSFQKSGTNGGSRNGIRLTWFDENGVLESVSPDNVYAEFVANAFVTAPDGAVAVNVVMWNGKESNEVYILNRDHCYENGICLGCGAVDPEALEPMSLRYDDHYDVTGKTVEIIDAGESVIALEGNDLVATGIGEAIVRVDGKLYCLDVDKAKINIVTIMGQSNAGNHFENATSDVTCPIGTAYWWGNGQGVNASEPVPYTKPSMGFHTPLLAELYAQSVAAGDPVKNVLVWQEGITSKNGQSIIKWAATKDDTSGTDATATMIKNCVAYFEQHSDKYEIVGNGVYWLQGESDVDMEPKQYTARFMAMWSKLKGAGAEYLAFLRVRKGVNLNGEDHEDLGYTGSLTAQLEMVNNNSDMFMATTITENWVGNADTKHSVDISKYLTLMEEYGHSSSHNDSYGNSATINNGVLTTTMKALYGSNNKCHYGKFGYGIIGADAAYHMYKALHTNSFQIVKSDTSGKANVQQVNNPGDVVTLDITELAENLAFRASCGSAAGTLTVTVKNGTENITQDVISAEVNNFGTVDTSRLKEYDSPVIIVTYKTVSGTSGSVTYNITYKDQEQSKVYLWDFEADLNARDENGVVVNSFEQTALKGQYALENGKLKATGLQLRMEEAIQLKGTDNWSIEWKLGQVNNYTKGFLLCNTETSKIGTKTIYMSPDMKISVSEYADSKGYRNYYADDAVFASGDVLRIENRYDSKTGRNVLSLWKNGNLVVSDYQDKGKINKTSDNPMDMSEYPLSGDFNFEYLGCKGIDNFSVTSEIDYIRIITSDAPSGPVIAQQPVDGEAKMGEKYMVEVKAEGEGLTYQWYFCNQGSKTWYKSSVRDNTYDDVMTSARAGREVYCVITDANGNSVTTETAKLICVPGEELAITKQPENGEAVMGERFCVTVEAKGDNLKYQWYFRNKGATVWTKSGVRDNTYDDVMTTARADREIYCVITDAYGNKVTSDTVKLIRIPMKLEITQQPADSEASLGEQFCVTVLARGEGLKYQWYFRNEGGLIWYKSGVKDNTYDDIMTKARMGREVYCVITDMWGNKVTTETAKLIGVPAVELEILTQPEDDSAPMGENFCITVEAQGDGLKYQWYFRNKGGSVWYKSGVKDNTYDDVMTKARAGREVYCVIIDAYGNQLTTQTAKIILK